MISRPIRPKMDWSRTSRSPALVKCGGAKRHVWRRPVVHPVQPLENMPVPATFSPLRRPRHGSAQHGVRDFKPPQVRRGPPNIATLRIPIWRNKSFGASKRQKCLFSGNFLFCRRPGPKNLRHWNHRRPYGPACQAGMGICWSVGGMDQPFRTAGRSHMATYQRATFG